MPATRLLRFNTGGSWTAALQMTLNGKRDGFTCADFEWCAKSAMMKRGRAATIIAEVQAVVQQWPKFASEAKLSDDWRESIQQTHRLSFPKT
jgi:serine/threonine-protein kinase HipA